MNDFERVIRYWYEIRDNVLLELQEIENEIVELEAEAYQEDG